MANPTLIVSLTHTGRVDRNTVDRLERIHDICEVCSTARARAKHGPTHRFRARLRVRVRTHL